MNQTTIFWPVLAHVALVYIVYGVLGRRRYDAVKSGEAKVGQYKARSTEPASSVTVAANLQPVRTAGAFLCAVPYAARHQRRQLSDLDAGVDFRPDALFSCLGSPDQQQSAAAQPFFLRRRGGAGAGLDLVRAAPARHRLSQGHAGVAALDIKRAA